LSIVRGIVAVGKDALGFVGPHNAADEDVTMRRTVLLSGVAMVIAMKTSNVACARRHSRCRRGGLPGVLEGGRWFAQCLA
jgi:hypothetical protein